MTNNPRYHGKSFLRLLECYVLWVIDQLPEIYAKKMQEITPKLQSIYKIEGNWQEIIATVMQLPSNMPELIREVWAKNINIAKKNDVVLTPQQFAEMFVDKNLF
jgi:hypothetical protein